VHKKIPAPADLISHTVEWVLSNHDRKYNASINIVLTDNKRIIELNTRYLQKKESTDVLAFDLSDDRNILLEGEIYLCLDRAVEQAGEYKVTFEQELIRLTAHGVLHLLGYRDDSRQGKKTMTHHEEAAITAMEKFL
jgi:probable rRNA maturation factor